MISRYYLRKNISKYTSTFFIVNFLKFRILFIISELIFFYLILLNTFSFINFSKY